MERVTCRMNKMEVKMKENTRWFAGSCDILKATESLLALENGGEDLENGWAES